MSELIQYHNCYLLRNSSIVKDDLWVRNGQILNPEPVFFVEKKQADVKVDCKGALIAPGFIDVQINGGFGIDFACNVDDVQAGIEKVATGILAHGVTSFCPTIVTSPPETYAKILPKIRKYTGKEKGAQILGTHLEGPFINTEKRGAHSTSYIAPLEKGFQTILDTYGTIDDTCMITMAPELPNALDAIPKLVKRGITVSLGHSMGNLIDGESAVQKGASFITHLFNAMLPFHHRDPGLVGLLSSEGKTVYYGLISDGIHTHPTALRIAFRTNFEGLVLVTDAISALGLGTGVHKIGQETIEIRDNMAFIEGTDTLCGSIANMSECVQFFHKATGCSKVEALEAATLHPAKALGVDSKKGTLNYGADADFIFLDDSLNVLATFIAGECVWRKSGTNYSK